MIIPTPEFDPLFAQDGTPFRDKMWDYIRREFGDLLGPQLHGLDADAGLKQLERQTPTRTVGSPRRADAA